MLLITVSPLSYNNLTLNKSIIISQLSLVKNKNNMYNIKLLLKIAIKSIEEAIKKNKRDLLELRVIPTFSKGIDNFMQQIKKKIEKDIIQYIKSQKMYYIKEEHEYEWIINPIDGKTNCIHGIPFFLSICSTN